MPELTIGGYKTRGEEFDDLIIDPTPQEQEVPEQPEIVQEHEQPVVEEQEVPEQPEIVQEHEQPVVEEQPVINKNEVTSSLVLGETENNVPNQVNDELIFKSLSEKLGREIKDYSDLTPKVENPLDSDPYLKNLVEWRNKTGRPIEDWVKYQKDYSSLSDVEVVSELLQHKYPTLTKDELQLEMFKYVPSEYDEDSEILSKNLELKKLAIEGRQVLSQYKSSFEQPIPVNYSPEVKEDLKLAADVKQFMKTQEDNKALYNSGINNITSKLNSFNIPLDSGAIAFKIPEESKKNLTNYIEQMDHWRNQDGSTNFEAIVTDAVKIKHFDDIAKVIYDQAFNAGVDSTLKETNNVNFKEPTPAGANIQGKKGIVIEGLDEFIGQRGMTIRTRI